MDLSTSSNIKRVALYSYRHDGMSYKEFCESVKSNNFDSLSDEEIEKEKDIIESEFCGYSTESVAKYRIAKDFVKALENLRNDVKSNKIKL